MGIVEKTWEELECKLRARGYWVIVRTEPHQPKVGSIWLPPRLSTFHGELPHLYNVTAVVLSSGKAGPAKEFKPGDRLVFQRLHFAYWKKMEDGTYVGWIDSNQVLGFADDAFVSQYVPSIA